MSAITITISSPGRAIVADGRLVAGESADVSVLGGVPAALYLVDASRDVVAACTSFVAGESSATGELDLATVPLADIVGEISAGRAIPLQAILEDAAGDVIGYGLVAVVSAPMPDALDPLDEDLIYAKLSDLRDYLTRAEADELYAPIGTATPIAPSTDPSAAGKSADAKATGDALAARPTKTQIDAGWWSEWTVLRNDADVTAECPQPEYRDTPPTWACPVLSSVGWMFVATLQEDAGATSLAWSYGSDNYAAARHRVAAPVPTKPSDIGAYQLPATGIPKTALAAAVQASLGKADTAVQPAGLRYAIDDSARLPDPETGAYQLADRTINYIQTSDTAIVVALPATRTDGRALDFFIRLTSLATTGADNVSIAFADPNIVILTPGAEMPPVPLDAETILYFSEIGPSEFLLKGETVRVTPQGGN